MPHRPPPRCGLTLLELMVVLAVLGVMISLLLPAIQASREAARRSSCANNLRQVALAVVNYHTAFEQLPPHGTGTFTDANPAATTNRFRLSFLVSILPFIDQVPLWEAITDRSPTSDYLTFNPMSKASMWMSLDAETMEQMLIPRVPMGPVPTDGSYPPWSNEVATYRCPSDPGLGLPALGRTNYAACLGDDYRGLDHGAYRHNGTVWTEVIGSIVDSARGAFIPRRSLTMAQITDGLSTTLLLGEIATDLGDLDIRTTPALSTGNPAGLLPTTLAESPPGIDPARPQFWSVSFAAAPGRPTAGTKAGRGFCWADMAPLMSGFNAITPPNTAVYLTGGMFSSGVVPPSSRHQGGCNVALCDGAVRFITDSIESGGGPLPSTADGPPTGDRGLWGAMSTRAGGEVVEGGGF